MHTWTHICSSLLFNGQHHVLCRSVLECTVALTARRCRLRLSLLAKHTPQWLHLHSNRVWASARISENACVQAAFLSSVLAHNSANLRFMATVAPFFESRQPSWWVCSLLLFGNEYPHWHLKSEKSQCFTFMWASLIYCVVNVLSQNLHWIGMSWSLKQCSSSCASLLNGAMSHRGHWINC